MYQPKIRDDQVRQLYLLAKTRNKPMTKLIREAVDDFLAKNGKEVHQDEDLSHDSAGGSIRRDS